MNNDQKLLEAFNDLRSYVGVTILRLMVQYGRKRKLEKSLQKKIVGKSPKSALRSLSAIADTLSLEKTREICSLYGYTIEKFLKKAKFFKENEGKSEKKSYQRNCRRIGILGLED
jgi:hypothetical protein